MVTFIKLFLILLLHQNEHHNDFSLLIMQVHSKFPYAHKKLQLEHQLKEIVIIHQMVVLHVIYMQK